MTPLVLILCGGDVQSVAAETQVERLISILIERPPGMKKETWMSERREAARELGRSRSRQAVPHLLNIVAHERLDVVLEIAIDALGKIGDTRAIGPLKNLLREPTLDPYVREATLQALHKLESSDTARTQSPAATGETQSRTPVHSSPPPAQKYEASPVSPSPKSMTNAKTPPSEERFSRGPRAPIFKDLLPISTASRHPDLLAVTSNWDIAAGSATIDWNKANNKTKMAALANTTLFRQVEKRRYGYRIDGTLGLDFHLIKPTGTESNWLISHTGMTAPEIRYYPLVNDFSKFFFQLAGKFEYGVMVSGNPQTASDRTSVGGTLTGGGGPGYGRLYNIGSTLRVKELESTLRRHGILRAPIQRDSALSLTQAWYALRNQLGQYHQLGHTLDILERNHHIDRESIDPALTYRLLRILEDPQLYDRPHGLIFRLGYGYSRNLIMDRDDNDMAFVYASGESAFQINTHQAALGTLRVFFDPHHDTKHYGAEFESTYRHYFYSPQFDPRGALGVSFLSGVGNQPGDVFSEGGSGYRVLTGLSYTFFFNRGSRLETAAQFGVNNNSPIVFLTLAVNYGLASGSFSTPY